MLNTALFAGMLNKHGINFFAGVPDSVLEPFCSYLDDTLDAQSHVITPNEGSAVALATGHYLSTGKLPVVYLQNAGLGNAVNPLTSLTNTDASRIPMLLMIGWRGFPGEKDEPQHRLMGSMMEQLLALMNIPYEILSADFQEATEQVGRLSATAALSSTPVALLVKKHTFEPFRREIQQAYDLYREDAICVLLEELRESVFVSTTGKCAREVYELRQLSGQPHERDFYNVGAMGHASMIALGIAMGSPKQHVCCLDGDGALLMHLGALANIGSLQPADFIHVILNNGAHDSVGGQRTLAMDIDIPTIARGNGYKYVYTVSGAADLTQAVRELKAQGALGLIEVKIANGVRKEPVRPDEAPHLLKDQLMKHLRNRDRAAL